MKKSSFITFCCAFFPGFGQMYQGYMHRGISLALAFWGLIFISAALSIGVLSILAPVIWAYSFFDTFNIRALTPEQRANFRDDYIPTKAWLQKNLKWKGMQGRGGVLIGIACVGIGIILLYNSILAPILWELSYRFPFIGTIIYQLPSLVIGIAVIILGLYLLRSNTKKKDNTPPSQDDIIPYQGEENDGEI